MAKGNSVKIRIDGDASNLEKVLSGVEDSAKDTAASIEKETAKVGNSLKDNLGGVMKEVAKEHKTDTKKVVQNIEEITESNDEVIRQKDKLDNVYEGIKTSSRDASLRVRAGLADIKAGFDIATAAAEKVFDVASKGVNYNATIEQLKTSFEVMTGSAEKAADVVDRLRVMGAETPFEMIDLASTTQLLMQYGFTADEAIDRMRMLGDVAQGNKDAMTSIAMGYAQMSSAGKVNLQDIKQMINGGFNPLQEISERTGESMESLYERISKGKMSVDEITESMRHATSEGGKFYQSMEKQSQTLNGQLSSLKDNADQLLGSLTEGVSDGLRDQIIPFASNLVAELQAAFDAGGYQGLVDTATGMIPDLLGMMTGELQRGIEGLTRWLPQGATQLMQALPGALRAGTAIAPQITQALFEVAGGILRDLVVMLPELAPILLDGFSDMFVNVVNGVYDMIGNVFTGIEQAFHEGQTKVAGMWVDTEATAKYTFNIDTETDPAEESISEAYRAVREALNTDLLTDEQRLEIEGMIGADYDSIKAKLLSFGISEEEASAIATTVTAAGETFTEQIKALNLSVDSATVIKWFAQANGSRIKLRAAMQAAGLSAGDQEAVIGVFENMTESITGALPNVIDEIYTTLTNGKIEDDDPKTLTQRLDEAFAADLLELEGWLQTNIAALDPESATYAEDVKAITDEAIGYKAELALLHAESVALVESLAGQPTAVVQARMAEFAEIEARIAEINAYIDETGAKARSAEEAAFNVVRSGAKADEETVSMAVSFKVSEYKLDVQSAEDAYKAAVAELNQQLDSGRISKAQYDARIHTEETKLEAAKRAALQAYETGMGDIFAGIAESEGIAEAARQAGEQLDLAEVLTAAAEELNMADDVTARVGNAFGETLTQTIADALQVAPEDIQNMRIEDLMGTLGDYANELFQSAENTIAKADNSKLQEVYAAALEQGILEGTKFDTESAGDQLTALYSSIFNSTFTDAQPAIQEASKALAEASVSEMGNYNGAFAAGGDTISGLGSALARGEQLAYRHGRAAGLAYERGYRETTETHSPSRAMYRAGIDTGKGLEIGLQESMARAVAVAKRMTGQIVTAADISGSIRVANMPNIQQDIANANANAPTTPVYLDGVKIAEIQGHNNSTQLAWQNTRAAKGVGSR